MPRTLIAAGEWNVLDEDHELRFVKASRTGDIIGGVLKHRVRGAQVWCEPGLIQWEPWGDTKPLFARNEISGRPISLTPFVVCEICGDKGFIIDGKWVPKDDDEGVSVTKPMIVLEEEENPLDENDDEIYHPAIRRDLGDKVPEEEKNADRKLYDVGGNMGGDVVITDGSDGFGGDDMPDESELEEAIVAAAKGHRPIDRQVQDSGHRRQFEGGAQRDRASGKGRYDLLQVMAIRRIAVILEKGAEKYDARNWERGMPLSVYVDSALRHLMQYVEGKTNEDHLGQAAWNLLAAMQTEEMIDMEILPRSLDDLPHYHDRDVRTWESE